MPNKHQVKILNELNIFVPLKDVDENCPDHKYHTRDAAELAKFYLQKNSPNSEFIVCEIEEMYDYPEMTDAKKIDVQNFVDKMAKIVGNNEITSENLLDLSNNLVDTINN